MDEKKLFTLLNPPAVGSGDTSSPSRIAGGPRESRDSHGSHIKYFDRYRLDVDNVRVDAEMSIREAMRNSIKQSIQPPPPSELLETIPLRYRSVPHLKNPTFDALFAFYNEELRTKGREMDDRKKAIEVKWDKCQKIFTDNLSSKITRHKRGNFFVTPQGGGMLPQGVNAERLIANPDVLECLGIPDTVRYQTAIEDEISGEMIALSARYTDELKKFCADWEPFFVRKFSYKTINDQKIREIKIHEKKEIDELNHQHTIAKQFVASAPPRSNKTISVECQLNGYDYNDNFELHVDETVKSFTQRYLKDKGISPPRFQAMITDGPAMIPHLKMSDYNLHEINQIKIVCDPK
jgi:hypothetical protein